MRCGDERCSGAPMNSRLTAVRRGRTRKSRPYGALTVTTKPIRLRGDITIEKEKPLRSGRILGVPWWAWVLGATGVAAVVTYFLTLPEPNPEEQPVPPDPNASTLPLTDIGGGYKLAPDAASAFLTMQGAANAVGVLLPVSTAWRSSAYQTKLYAAYQAYLAGTGPWAPMAAKPGNSKHEFGLALDLTGVDSSNSNFNQARRDWLDANAETYGWKNVGMAFINREPWHYEFQGFASA